MDALTYALGLNLPADARLERVRQPRATPASTPTALGLPGAAQRPRWPAEERRGTRAYSKGFGGRFAANIETALFVATLAVIACLNYGALPALAL